MQLTEQDKAAREVFHTDKGQNISKKLKSSTNVEKKKVIVILLVLLSITAAVFCNAHFNVEEMEAQLQQNLADVARQNAVILKEKIDAKYELIHSLTKELADVTTETIDEELGYFKVFMEDFHLKRFAFCFPDGTTYSTDGEVTDLSYREFYQAGMEGRSCITGVLTDALRAEHGPVNVMTVPLFDETGNVSGVFGLAYDTEVFNEAMQIDSFEGKGYSCIINESGEIMAGMGNDALKLSYNIMEVALEADAQNAQAVENLRSQMEQKKEGSGILYLSGKNYYYCVPVDLMDGSVTWYILTMIPSAVLNERVMPIQMSQYLTSFGVAISVLAGALLIIWFIKKQQEQMMRFAYEDPLTGGANFVKFCMDMENRKKREGYLIAVDITNFNNITIAAGEEASDAMLKEMWNIIRSSLRREELAGRVRDDMFLLFLSAPNEDTLIERMEQISGQIGEKSRDLCVYGIRAGYGIYPVSGEETIENAYSKAKLAREFAASKPQLHYAFYNEVNRVKTQQEKQLEERFPEALENEEFEVWYQPKYSAADCAVVGSEALVRWRSENGEMVSPGKFIPLFEQNGMIVKLDEYMFGMVCRQQKKWLDEGKVVHPVSVNISRASLYGTDVERRYGKIMQECGIEPQYIQLEVTETVMEEKTDICELLNRFRQMGVKILMDDFGTGYSSLATLSTQCFDTLKLDKTLIDHIGTKDGETLLYHIIRMGQQMGLHITAEGVERQAQLEFLQHLKCDDIQGFYFAKPMPVEEYETIVMSE